MLPGGVVTKALQNIDSSAELFGTSASEMYGKLEEILDESKEQLETTAQRMGGQQLPCPFCTHWVGVRCLVWALVPDPLPLQQHGQLVLHCLPSWARSVGMPTVWNRALSGRFQFDISLQGMSRACGRTCLTSSTFITTSRNSASTWRWSNSPRSRTKPSEASLTSSHVVFPAMCSGESWRSSARQRVRLWDQVRRL